MMLSDYNRSLTTSAASSHAFLPLHAALPCHDFAPSVAEGLTPDQLSKFVSNPEVMVLMQDPKMQEIMKKVRDTESAHLTLSSAKMSQQGGWSNRRCDNRGNVSRATVKHRLL